MNKKSLVIATRESPLALWQARWVQQQLQKRHPDLSVTLLGMTTQGDQLLSETLQKNGGKGLFVKELEEALRDGRADIAVHSMKDVPMELPSGFLLPVMCEREDPRDVFVSNTYQTLFDLPKEALVGTSSLRRQSQLYALRSDIKLQTLRGNVNTRLSRLDAGEFSAIILAAAGLKRLGLADRICSYISVDQSLPAAGQGVLGIECRAGDHEVMDLIEPLNHAETSICVRAERAMCRRLGGGCQVPIGAFAELADDRVTLRGLVGRVDGSLLLSVTDMAHVHEAEVLGVRVAEQLILKGADVILNPWVQR